MGATIQGNNGCNNTRSSDLENERPREELFKSYQQYKLEQQNSDVIESTRAAASREIKKQKLRATKSACLSEYQEIMHRSKQSMEPKPWQPKDIKTDPEKESELMKKMQNVIVELEKSVFYSKFLQQIQTPPFLNHLSRVLGSEPKFEIVIYGTFSYITSFEPSRTQLALMLLMKRDFNDRIGEMQVFDSKFDQTEVRVLEELGFSVLRVDENGYRKVSKPTLFFIPHCESEVYDHVLRANWKPENLNRMILFGNDLSGTKYTEMSLNENFRLPLWPFNRHYIQISRYLMCVSRFVAEVPLTTSGEAFSSQTWHFFIWFDDVPKIKPVVVVAGIFYYLYFKYIKCKKLHERLYKDPSYSSYLYFKNRKCKNLYKRLYEEPSYSSFFRLGWLFRRYRMRLDKQRFLEKKRMLFYVSRAIVLPWLVGLPRKKWAAVREISQGVVTWMKENDDEISYRQLDILIQAWF